MTPKGKPPQAFCLYSMCSQKPTPVQQATIYIHHQQALVYDPTLSLAPSYAHSNQTPLHVHSRNLRTAHPCLLRFRSPTLLTPSSHFHRTHTVREWSWSRSQRRPQHPSIHPSIHPYTNTEQPIRGRTQRPGHRNSTEPENHEQSPPSLRARYPAQHSHTVELDPDPKPQILYHAQNHSQPTLIRDRRDWMQVL